MFKKTISGLSLVAAAFGLAAFSTPAAACTNTADAWDCIHDGTGSYPTTIANARYYGSGTLSHWYIGALWCNKFAATADVTISGGTATMDITGFYDNGSTSDARCANVGFSNFDWSGTHDGTGSPNSETDTTPVKFELYTLVISYNGTTICNDSVTITFTNDGSGGSCIHIDDSISGWAGSCSIDATLCNSTISAH